MPTARPQPRPQTRSIGRQRPTTGRPAGGPTRRFARTAKPPPSRFRTGMPARRKPQQSKATKAGLNALGVAKGISVAGRKGASKTPNFALLAALGAGAAAIVKKRRAGREEEAVATTAAAQPVSPVAAGPEAATPPTAPSGEPNGTAL